MVNVIRLRGNHFANAHVCCLGEQLSQLVEVINEYSDRIDWYSADVAPTIPSTLFSDGDVKPVGDTAAMIAASRKIDQFESGVFIAVQSSQQNPRFRTLIETDDKTDADLCDALVEIRAFDTSFFELVGSDERLMTVVAEKFQTPLEEE